ncbi:prepilin-type N-terminal cleavage/methylation domain-containing protein [Victivallis vadensis]|uniref:prepilin-type N-terminal cleavage/methylation domain-containing protein n=1 Tax=Victivallis vadensis TaxID=172901 RepID=UPI00307D44E0
MKSVCRKFNLLVNEIGRIHNFSSRLFRGGEGVHGPAASRQFTLIELLIVIAIIAIVVTSKAGFFLQFSAIFAFKAL